MAAATTSTNPKSCHVAYLVQLVFYFYLWAWKYTRQLRTVQLHPLFEFFFFFVDCLLPEDVPIKWFYHTNQFFLILKTFGLSLPLWVHNSLHIPLREQHLPLHSRTDLNIPHLYLWLSIHPLKAPLHQRLWHNHHPPNQGGLGQPSQTRFWPIICQDTLCMIWRKHGHSRYRVFQTQSCCHQTMALTRICGIHSTIYFLIQRGRLRAHETTPMVHAPLVTAQSIKIKNHPTSTLINHRHLWLTKIPPIMTSQPNLYLIIC